MDVSESATHKQLEKRSRYVARGISTAHPIVADHADGTTIWDIEGNAYLDFAGGIGAMNVGHQHPSVVATVQAQLERMAHTPFQVALHEPYLDLAERLSVLIGASEPYKAILFTSGSEAIENAVKIARSHTNRPAVVAFTGGFHGRTLLALTLTASGHAYRQNFGPFVPEIYHVPFPYEYRGWTVERSLEAFRELLETRLESDRIAAVLIEPQLGEGGFVPAPKGFLEELRRITVQHGIVLIVDEIQSGFGRTGKMFAYEHYNIQPDIVTVAKSLGAGLPVSGVVGKAAMMDAPLPGSLGGTYGGNPLACVAALAVLDIFEKENLVARAEGIGQQLREGLQRLHAQFSQIGDVRGLGAMLALEFVRDRESRTPDGDLAQRVLESARKRGLLLLKCGVYHNVVRFLPPLTTTPAEIAQAIDIVGTAIEEAAK